MIGDLSTLIVVGGMPVEKFTAGCCSLSAWIHLSPGNVVVVFVSSVMSSEDGNEWVDSDG